jgi:hypothetical protein
MGSSILASLSVAGGNDPTSLGAAPFLLGCLVAKAVLERGPMPGIYARWWLKLQGS